MRNLIAILITLIAAIGTTAAQTSQEQDLAIGYLKLATEAESEGSIATAIECYQQAAEYAKRGFGEKHELYHMAIFGLMGNYFQMQIYNRTIEYGELLLANEDIRTTHPAEYAIACYSLAVSYASLLQYDKALERGLQCLSIWDSMETDVNTKQLYAELCGVVAEAYYDKGKIDKSIEYTLLSIEFYSTDIEQYRLNYAMALFKLGTAYDIVGDTRLCIDYLLMAEQQLQPFRGYSDDVDSIFGCIYHILGSSYSMLGEQTRAIKYMKQAQPLLELNIKEYEGLYVFNQLSLAGDAGAKGDYVAAERYAEQVIPLLESVQEKSNDERYVMILVQLAQYRDLLGERESAAELFNEALAILTKITSVETQHNRYYLQLQALCYDWLGRDSEALECYLRLLEMMGSDTKALPEERADILLEITDIYAEIGMTTESIAYGEQLIALVEEHNITTLEGYANTLYNIVSQYNQMEGYEKRARYLLLKSYNEARREHGPYHSLCSRILFMMCNHHYDDGNYESLSLMWFQFYKQVQDTIFRRFRDMTARQREYFWTQEMSQMLAFGSGWYTPVLAEDSSAMTTSYDAMLLSKGLLLSYEIEFERIIRQSGDEELIQTLNDLKMYRSELNRIYVSADKHDEREVRLLEEAAEKCEKKLIEKSKEYAEYNRRSRLNLHWFDVQEALGEGDVAVEFMEATEATDEPYYAALVLRRDWEAPQYVYIGSSSEIEQIFHNGHKIYSGRLSEQLHRMVWGALEPYINEGDNIYFAPAGVLHQINIEVLTDAVGRRANERYNPVRLSSTRELCLPHEQKPQSEAVLYGDLKYDISAESMLFASRRTRGEGKHIARRGFNPSPHLRDKIAELPATADELRDIASTLGERGITTRLFTRGEGNEESFKALSGSSPQILHIATHGFFFQDEEAQQLPFYRTQGFGSHTDTSSSPLRRSGLILSGGERAWLGEELPTEVEDGILLSEEIATMDLGNVELVVLSACDTGLGEISSEGVFGLQRAFKMAGVKSIMMSLWKVEDRATSLFMQTFYREWKGGATKREAFAEAQRRVREEYNPSPEYWAAFILLD